MTHAKASLPTAGAILVSQRADDLIVGVGDGERAGKRRPRWHARCRHPRATSTPQELVELSARPQGENVRSQSPGVRELCSSPAFLAELRPRRAIGLIGALNFGPCVASYELCRAPA